MVELTIEDENKVIDSIKNKEFWAVMRKEFPGLELPTMLGYAAVCALTLKETPLEMRAQLVEWNMSEATIYRMFAAFRRLRRALLASKDVAMREQRGGPGMNDGILPVVVKINTCRLAGMIV